MPKFILKPTDPAKLEADILINFCFEEDIALFSLHSQALTKLFAEATSREDFKGKLGESVVLYPKGIIASYKLLIMGLGKKEKLTVFDIQQQIAGCIKAIRDMHPAKIAFVIPDFWFSTYSTELVVQSLVEAVFLSTYRFAAYKTDIEKKKRVIEEVIINLPANKIASGEQGLKRGEITGIATCFARDLINEPPFVTTPTYLAQTATTIAKNSKGSIKVTILEKEEVQKFGMNAFLGVARGSDEPPKFILLKYKPAKSKTKVVLVGKGITFDTGGLSLKSAEHMETMKLDMSGAAAVLAVFSAIPQLMPAVEVTGIIPACENMPSGKALKPGDILKAMNGKTIEVLNTDAEGRLTLADAFSYALSREKPGEIIELSTLTGACMVALGQDIAGMWSNDEKLSVSIIKSAQEAGEKIWNMPLETGYKELIKSTIADVKNIQTGKYGGAITAALFLREFVGETAWVHLDIAGPAFAEKDIPLTPAGGAGFGVRLLLHYLDTR